MKEQTAKKERRSRNFWHRNQRLTILVLILLIVIAASAIIFYPTRIKHISEQNQSLDNIKITAVDNPTDENNQDATDQGVTKTADEYYNDAQNYMTAQNWSSAISSFDQAIALNQKEPNYYNRKAQAQYNLGQKDQSIATLEVGIENNPNSDLLKSRLDVMQKESVSSQPQ
jgi:tetratricopeptide (TPR) repeat protein